MLRTSFCLLVMVLGLSACTSVPLEKDVYPDDPAYSPVSAQSLQPPPTVDGSLFQASYSMGLFTDQQARRSGDIITVIFDEQYQSSKSAETTADKSSASTSEVNSMMGMVPGWKNIGFGVDTNADRQFRARVRLTVPIV